MRIFQPQTNGGLHLGCVRLYTFVPDVPETDHTRSQRSLVNRKHKFRETLTSPEHHFGTDVGVKTSFLSSALTCKCSTTTHIPGANGMTQQESLVPVIKTAPIQHLPTFFTKKQRVWLWNPAYLSRNVCDKGVCDKNPAVWHFTSLALSASESVRTHTSVGSHTSSSVETAILTNSYRAEDKENK